MAIRGAQTGFNPVSDQLIREVSQLYIVQPQDYALISVLNTRGLKFVKEGVTVNVLGTPLSKMSVSNFKYEVQSQEIIGQKDYINLAGGYAADATSLVVDNSEIFPKYAMVKVPRTGEIFWVTSVTTATDALTVSRGFAGTTAAALNDNDELIVLGPAYPENSVSGDITNSQPSYTYNYTQIFRAPYGLSRTRAKTKVYNTTDQYEQDKLMKLVEILRFKNAVYWDGERSTSTSDSTRTTAGILTSISASNVRNASGNLTEAEFDSWLTDVFNRKGGSREKTIFAGSRGISAISGFAKNRLELNQDIASIYSASTQKFEYGLVTYKYHTPFGKCTIVYEPYFDQQTSGTYPLSTWMVALDMDFIDDVFLMDSDLQARDDIQANDVDGRKGEWLFESGVRTAVPEAHHIIKNI